MPDVIATQQVIWRKIRLEMPDTGPQPVMVKQGFVAVNEIRPGRRRLCQLIAGIGRQNVVVVGQCNVTAACKLCRRIGVFADASIARQFAIPHPVTVVSFDNLAHFGVVCVAGIGKAKLAVLVRLC